MWTTVEETKTITGFDVTLETIHKAQAIIESYVGRLESEVTNANDQMLLGRATAYQAVYMNGDEEIIFQQVHAQQTAQFGNMLTYRADDHVSPYVAPLAVIACQRLSWKRMRSIKTGSIYDEPIAPPEWSKD